MPTNFPSVLTITGSDSTGEAGIGADIRTISALGGRALVAITSVVVSNGDNALSAHDLPAQLVAEQIQASMIECPPRAVKVGLVRDEHTIALLPSLLSSIPRRVMIPSVLDSQGRRILSSQALDAWMRHLLPLSTLLILRVKEAEIMLGRNISTDEELLQAAQELRAMGAGAVMMRGGHTREGFLTALLLHEVGHRFFTSRNTVGWQRHGVSGALSSAIATRYALGDDTTEAVANAHTYLHSQVVYAVSPSQNGTYALRSADIYNSFISLIAEHYSSQHGIAFYASSLCVSPRYLCSITDKMVGRSPKQILSDYLLQEATSLLTSTRLTVQEISIRLGFSTQAEFSRFFSKLHGCSPMAFRIGGRNSK